MLIPNFKSAWRNLLQNPFSSAINIIGLTTGITCCIFISLYVWSEMRADDFNVNKENIFRVNQLLTENSRGGVSTSYPLGTSLQTEYPGIRVVRLGQDNVSVRAGGEAYFYEEKFYWADSSFFDVFSNRMVKGDPKTALSDPYSLVITETMAKKYFKDEEPLGKTVELKIYDGNQKFNFRVTGVVENPSKIATVQFEFLAPMRAAMLVYPQFEQFWGIHWVSTFVMTDHPEFLPNKTQSTDFLKKYTGNNITNQTLEFQPLPRVHLYSGHIGNNLTNGITNIYIFTCIGGFIFLLACVNFVNLSTARAELRKKEIGVRKALGAVRRQLFIQFMTEAMLVSAIVMVMAVTATSALLPLASAYIPNTSPFLSSALLPLFFVGALFLVGIFAGFYPAIFLSGFKPLEALRAKPEKAGGFGNSARQMLVMFQFTISIALIAGTLIISKQVHYLKQADLGFTQDQLITIPVDDRALQQKIQTVKELIATTPGLGGIAVSGEAMPAAMNNTEDIQWPELAPGDVRSIDIVAIDPDFLPLIHAEFLEGRNISRDRGTDSSSVILNDAARERISGEITGKEVTIGGKKMTVAGIVKNIHHYSLHQKVRPIAYRMVPASDRACADNLFLKISPAALPTVIPILKQKWETLTQDRPFEYHFVDTDFAKSYEADDQFLTLFELFSGLAIVIACLGLMGLSSFVVNRRSKEIGIRKVLGASIGNIVLMLTKGFSIPIASAFLVAAPCVYYIMSGWLNTFAYKITADLLLILLAGVVAWLIAFSFIGIQSWKAARVNPAKILKDE